MTTHGPGQVLFEFVRRWSRRSAAEDPVLADQGRLVLVAEAVQSLTTRGAAVTVNAIADEIGIDQSGASRLVKRATTAGHVEMSAPAADGRRREATLTAAGRSLLDQAHRWQEDVFLRLSADWSPRRRHEFQQAMADLMRRSHELDATTLDNPPPNGT